MDIRTAATFAQRNGGYITRRTWKEHMYISTVTIPGQCVCSIKGGEIYRGWQPRPEDLAADDWEVIQTTSKNDDHSTEEEVEGLTQVETIRFTTALLNFIERATRPEATCEELTALPKIAEILSRFC